jgi:hypothetical protein
MSQDIKVVVPLHNFDTLASSSTWRETKKAQKEVLLKFAEINEMFDNWSRHLANKKKMAYVKSRKEKIAVKAAQQADELLPDSKCVITMSLDDQLMASEQAIGNQCTQPRTQQVVEVVNEQLSVCPIVSCEPVEVAVYETKSTQLLKMITTEQEIMDTQRQQMLCGDSISTKYYQSGCNQLEHAKMTQFILSGGVKRIPRKPPYHPSLAPIKDMLCTAENCTKNGVVPFHDHFENLNAMDFIALGGVDQRKRTNQYFKLLRVNMELISEILSECQAKLVQERTRKSKREKILENCRHVLGW